MESPFSHDSQTETGENKSSAGGLVATIIIITLMVIGAFYFGGKQLAQKKINAQIKSDIISPTAVTP